MWLGQAHPTCGSGDRPADGGALGFFLRALAIEAHYHQPPEARPEADETW
jgi:hypothetical protein